MGIVLGVILVGVGGVQAGQYGVRPHSGIYVCSDDPAVIGQLQRGLPPSFHVIDGTKTPPPDDIAEVTLAYFGRPGGAAEKCAMSYPGGRNILDRVVRGAERSARETEERIKKLGGKVVGHSMPMGSMEWDSDSGASSDWFVDLCLLPINEECPDLSGPSRLLDMARAD
ncbi:hypothetical protein ASC89_12500 [Devosia sp. Root413D1]|uniref:hypothetical protein n=1 Tax=unclassified Devosia TaxID=196773 RepID=UPI0006F910C3|nr:hypothetical protein [Devosia sp. Root413D1]KQW79115.1 hypothetical protein ASC89_12500 [Devosia sp. Root413D1]